METFFQLREAMKGGSGSGFYGHAGRRGKVGGSTRRDFRSEIALLDSNKKKDIEKAEQIFRDMLYEKYPDGLPVYHESPGDVAESMKRQGILGDYGIFGTIAAYSNFVTTETKTIVKFHIPPSRYDLVAPDMRYDNALDLLKKHNGIARADISLALDNVPPSWFQFVRVEKDGRTIKEL